MFLKIYFTNYILAEKVFSINIIKLSMYVGNIIDISFNLLPETKVQLSREFTYIYIYMRSLIFYSYLLNWSHYVYWFWMIVNMLGWWKKKY